MAIQYTIQSDVVDIRVHQPQPGDRFFVDTNVWFWLTYSGASQGSNNLPQARQYPKFIGFCRKVKAQLYWCGLSMAELAHIIEKTEREIYVAANGEISTKAFRHNNSNERAKIVAEINTSIGLVKTYGNPIDVNITEKTTIEALTRLGSEKIDGYDAFLLEANKKAGIIKIITDDGDYATVPGIIVYTANRNIIDLATQQNKLLNKKLVKTV